MTRSLRLVAPLRPPNLRSWSCQAKALASSSRLLRKAAGGWSKVAVQIAKSSAPAAALSSESLGIAGCRVFLLLARHRLDRLPKSSPQVSAYRLTKSSAIRSKSPRFRRPQEVGPAMHGG